MKAVVEPAHFDIFLENFSRCPLKTILSSSEVADLVKDFPFHSNADLLNKYKITERQLFACQRKHSLLKDKDYLAEMRIKVAKITSQKMSVVTEDFIVKFKKEELIALQDSGKLVLSQKYQDRLRGIK